LKIDENWKGTPWDVLESPGTPWDALGASGNYWEPWLVGAQEPATLRQQQPATRATARQQPINMRPRTRDTLIENVNTVSLTKYYTYIIARTT